MHLTASLDGLTTTFLVRDFGGLWAPFHEACSLARIRGDVRSVLGSGRGLLHFPLHGEVALYVSEPPGELLRTAYHHPGMEPDGASWISSLVLGAGSGLTDVEQRLPSSRLALAVLRTLLGGNAIDLGDGTKLRSFPAADLLAIGYGAHDRGERTRYPFERTIGEILEHAPPRDRGQWRALVYRPDENRRVASWYAQRGFRVEAYGDDDLAQRTTEVLAARPSSECGVPERSRRAASVRAR